MRKLVTILALAGCVVLGCVVTGCGTTNAAKAAQAEKIVITGVNDGMAEWRDYVNAGKATQKQIDNVRLGYQSYVVAQAAAKAAIERSITGGDTAASRADQETANQAVLDAEAQLLSLLNSYIKQ